MFLGRENELTQLATLASKGSRLVTLWGPGGVGKTTLARRVAAEALWVELASARTREETIAACATALGVEVAEADEAATLRAARARRQRIVADNAEQLDDPARAFLVALSNVAPLLVTSRDALRVEGEAAIEVGPLAEEEAIALYTRLSNTAPDDDARAIVARLDALPLAIELAAARAPLLGSAALRERLETRFDVLQDKSRVARHATLHATIAWSWDLLAEAEQSALVSCARFEAPFDAGLAEAVIGDDALDALDALRRRALLLRESPDTTDTTPRFRLFEAVRAFARARAPESGVFERYGEAVVAHVEPLAAAVRRGEAVAAELRRRRADLIAIASANEAKPELRARASLALAALRSVTGPHDGGREAADVRVDGELALRLVIAKGLAARAAGRLDDAEASAESALTARPDDPHALRLAGMVARSRGDVARAVSLLERALDQYRRDAVDEAFAGLTLGELGAAEQSVARLAEGIAILVATKSVRAEGLLRSHLAVVTHRRGEPRAAVALHEAALAIHRRVGNRRLEGAERLHLGFVHHEIAELDAARAAFDEARATLAEAGALGLEALACVLRARLDVDAGDTVAARIALAEAARITPPGWHRLVATHHVVAGHLAMAEGDRPGAVTHYEQALAVSRDVEVGFEALTPVYCALAAGQAAKKSPDAHSTPSFTNPHLAEAWNILAGVAATASPAAIAASSDVRRALAFVGKKALIITERSLTLPDGRAVDLSKRKNVRFILAALAKAAGAWVDADALIAAGWPGERMRPDAATKRLHTAIWTLRKLGLEGILESSEAGYRLDPSLTFEWL